MRIFSAPGGPMIVFWGRFRMCSWHSSRQVGLIVNMLKFSALLLVAVLASAPAVWAEPSGDMDPNVSRKELEGLRTKYTDQHPNVILWQRKLEKAEEIKRRRESREIKPRGQPGSQPGSQENAGRPPDVPPASVDSNG